MPAKNPRLTITITPELAAQLRQMSELTGNSQSKIVAELLDGSGPVFDRLIQVLTAAKDATSAMKGKLAGDMEHAQSKLEKQLGLVFETFDGAAGSLLAEAEAIKRRARRGAAQAPAARSARSFTPPSNRGVRSTPKRKKNRGE